MPIDATFVERLYRKADAKRWRLSKELFAETLQASAQRGLAGQAEDPGALERYLSGLHLEDLALACACAEGDEEAWEHFVLDQRPLLYRAADVLDPGGGARDLADSLYADLFGLRESGGERRSLFRYFHGRSSLTTWLRAVLAQRHVDRLRTDRREDRLPDDESSQALPAREQPIDTDRRRHLALMQRGLASAVANLPPRDRLRLACYYAQELTLAQTGRLLGEHEATSSRQLARTRTVIRDAVERRLRDEHRMSDDEVAQCFACVVEDAGPMDLRNLLDVGSARKESALDRSK